MNCSGWDVVSFRPVHCINCGNPLKYGVRFCPKCGAPVMPPQPVFVPVPVPVRPQQRQGSGCFGGCMIAIAVVVILFVLLLFLGFISQVINHPTGIPANP